MEGEWSMNGEWYVEPNTRLWFKKELSQELLRTAWTKWYSDKSFPKVRAFLVDKEGLENCIKRLDQLGYKIGDIEEYGEKVMVSDTEGLVFYEPKTEYFFIVINEELNKGSYPIIEEEVLECLGHELRHIYKGDGKRTIKP